LHPGPVEKKNLGTCAGVRSAKSEGLQNVFTDTARTECTCICIPHRVSGSECGNITRKTSSGSWLARSQPGSMPVVTES